MVKAQRRTLRCKNSAVCLASKEESVHESNTYTHLPGERHPIVHETAKGLYSYAHVFGLARPEPQASGLPSPGIRCEVYGGGWYESDRNRGQLLNVAKARVLWTGTGECGGEMNGCVRPLCAELIHWHVHVITICLTNAKLATQPYRDTSLIRNTPPLLGPP